MPGPVPHMGYAMTTGLGLMGLTSGRFGPHHVVVYAANAFVGPDLGSFSEWVGSNVVGGDLGEKIGSFLMRVLHDPFYYVLVLGVPLSFFYGWLSRVLLEKGLLDSLFSVPLTRRQCFLLLSAGSLSHFFLDHLFEENGHSSMYTWILSTGWWKGRAPIYPDSVLVVGFLCTCLVGGFMYINRLKLWTSVETKVKESIKLVLAVAILYCLWCASQLYWRNPPRPPVGEEADLGVIVFLAIYFFLPHTFCIMSLNPKEYLNTTHLPL
ncbi:hypothetical protein QJS10_CPA08g01682 [Acorus calamus]|uniref:Uncharacterized protein n=1 Tax=Acorus calamus TaxID=4465 RepID=A0AAV9E8H7_ACOCL|nr:hypothetical protein QJS10_CPA08g01682 [Acorus calamus]